MPDATQKNESSAQGPWFADQLLCQGCGACVSIAPKNIKPDEDELAYFFRQPRGEEEEKSCLRALEACPHLAIGKED
jgi:ferredoxin